MEIRYTIEILTKDIQEIEKLVGNLQNSPNASAIELDLALSKLRNVYDILTLIKADRFHEMIPHEQDRQPGPEPLPDPVPEAKPETKSETKSEAKPETKSEAKPETKSEARSEAKPETKSEAKPEAKPETKSEARSEAKPETKSEAKPEAKPETKSEARLMKGAEILAERFSAESSINENLGGKRAKSSDTKIQGQHIDNIGRNIGINDRFLIIRELFGGDSDKFGNLVNDLEGTGNYEDAASLLEAQFSDQMDHEGVEILAGLIRRRFTQL